MMEVLIVRCLQVAKVQKFWGIWVDTVMCNCWRKSLWGRWLWKHLYEKVFVKSRWGYVFQVIKRMSLLDLFEMLSHQLTLMFVISFVMMNQMKHAFVYGHLVEPHLWSPKKFRTWDGSKFQKIWNINGLTF